MGETRKLVTVVFSDVTGSTELTERLEPEAVRAVLARYFDAMRRVLELHGGTVEKYVGDAVMAVFGVPHLHEDDALRAVRAAIEMRSELAALNEALERDAGVTLETRTGLMSGEVVAGDPAARERLVTGDAVNVAARLQQAAEPGEILVGDATHRLVAAAVEAEPVDGLALKGKREPVAAWRLLSVRPGAGAFARRLDAPMIGRREELDTLRQALASSFASRVPHAVTVVGPAGIGKTRLVNELIAEAGDEMRVLLGRCLPYGEGSTYWPLAEIARQAGVEPAAFGLASGATSQETFWAARAALERLAGEGPLLVAFDDVHWGEPTFLDLLEYVRGFAAGVPLVVLCQARPELLELRPSWSVPAANATTVALGPLSDAESRELLGHGLEEKLAERILTWAEGNPLFVEQLSAVLVDGDSLDAVPATIQALLGARIDRLDGDERQVLERASIEGAVFHRTAVEALVPEPERPRLGALLMALVRKGLLRPDRSAFAGDDAFRFGHLMIRDAVYAAIPKNVRAAYHEGHARWLEQAVGPQEEQYEALLGYHWEQTYLYAASLAPPDDEVQAAGGRAASLLGSAGRRAYARSDVAAAVGLLDRTAALPTPDEKERVELLLLLSVALDFAGETARADEVGAKALDAAHALGDRRLLALARAQAGAVALHTDPSMSTADYAPLLEDAIAACGEAGDEYGLALSLRRLGWVRQLEGRFDASVRELERAAEHAHRAGHAREETFAVAMLVSSLTLGTTPVGEAIARCRLVLEQTESELAGQRAAAHASLGLLHAMSGDIEEGRSQATLGWHVLAPFGERHAAAQGATFLGQVELLAGDPVAAEAALRQGYEPLKEMGDTGFRATAAAHLAEAVRRQGRAREAQALAEEAAELAPPDDRITQSLWRRAQARVLAGRGEHDAAERLARAAIEAVEGTDAVVDRADALLALAETLEAAGRVADVASLAAQALELYGRKGDSVDAARARELQDRVAGRLGAPQPQLD